MKLVRVTAYFRLSRPDPPSLEDELVRRGAREAHLTRSGAVAILVAAASTRDAAASAAALLTKVGATNIRIREQDPAPGGYRLER